MSNIQALQQALAPKSDQLNADDLIVSNIPFGNFKVYDENIKEFFSYDIVDQTIDISKMIKEILKEDDKKIVASKFINTVANIE